MVKRRGTKANTTKSGKPSAAARRKYGAKKSSPLKTGSYPVWGTASGKNALRARGRGGKTPAQKRAVINKVSRFANAHHNKTLQAAVKKARARMKKK